jgi:hypothetical protein
VVFVRVLEPLATGTYFPIAYQAMNIIRRAKDGRAWISLERPGVPAWLWKKKFFDFLPEPCAPFFRAPLDRRAPLYHSLGCSVAKVPPLPGRSLHRSPHP